MSRPVLAFVSVNCSLAVPQSGKSGVDQSLPVCPWCQGIVSAQGTVEPLLSRMLHSPEVALSLLEEGKGSTSSVQSHLVLEQRMLDLLPIPPPLPAFGGTGRERWEMPHSACHFLGEH